MLSITLLLLYIAYFVYTFNGTIPDGVWSTIYQYGMICVLLYAVGGFLWNTKRKRKPSLDKAGRLLLSVSFLLAGILLSLVVVFFSTRPGEISQSVRTPFILLNMGFGSIALGLIGAAVYTWKKLKEKPQMACPYCDRYVPEDFITCPHCGKKIR